MARDGWGKIGEQFDAPCAVEVGSSVITPLPLIRLSPTQCEKYPKGKLIGKGSYAAAYSLATDPSKVVKFTADPGDAAVSKKLIGSMIVGAVKVFDVAKLKGHTGLANIYNRKTGTWEEKETPIFAIVTEKLEPLPKHYGSVHTAAIDTFFQYFKAQRREVAGLKTDKIKTPTDVLSAMYGDKYLGWLDTMEDVCKDSAKKDKEYCRPLILEAFAAAAELGHETGAMPLDLHRGNWGLRNGRLVILDFGVSSGEDAGEIKELAGASLEKNMSKRSRKSSRRSRSLGAFKPNTKVMLWVGGLTVAGILFANRRAIANYFQNKKPGEYSAAAATFMGCSSC